MTGVQTCALPIYINNNALFSDSVISFPLDERKIIARCCAINLRKDSKVLNYGIGISATAPWS